ncbi:hypothetical protein E4U21_002089 [Claviceps maximensis]|nr:hypothetical protein E4U21_002089 [Claviceps maximensis]
MSSSHSLPPTAAAATTAPIAIPRQQISIDRLPGRRPSSEPRESMNCKSCRKRKIVVWATDAIPKKRGPKTDMLEALLKRVDGLEAKLNGKNEIEDLTKSEESSTGRLDEREPRNDTGPASKRIATDTGRAPREDGAEKGARKEHQKAIDALPGSRLDMTQPDMPHTTKTKKVELTTHSRTSTASLAETDAFLHTYFTRFHAKPYYILDEASTRHKIRVNQLPEFLQNAIWAVASRHTLHPNGLHAAIKRSEEYASRTRQSLDTDEPCIESLQALLLLVTAFTASGHGKKAYMLMCKRA